MQRLITPSRQQAPPVPLAWDAIPRRLGRLPVWHLLTVPIVLLLLLPLAYLLLRAVGAGTEGIDYLLRPRTLNIVKNSVVLVGLVSMSSALIGVPFAWLTTRTDLPLRRMWLVLGLLPMVIPSYVAAIAYVDVFSPSGPLAAIFGRDAVPSIYGLTGAWLIITLLTYPYVALVVRAALLNSDPALEEAARGLGLRRWSVFFRATLPQLRPALAAGMLLTALYTLSDFGVVMVLRYNAFTRAIYISYQSSFDRNRAAILALVLVLLMIVLLLVERWVAAGKRHYRVGTGAARRPSTQRLGAWRIPALLFCGALVVLGVGVPVLVLLGWAANPNVASAIPLNLTTLSLNTIGVSGLAALAAAVVALPLAIVAVRAGSRATRILVRGAYLGNTLPGIVVGLALVFFVIRAAPSLYQTIPILILGYVIRFLPFTLASTRSALTQVNPALEEAARGLGLNAWQVAIRVTLPLVWSGIVAGMALVFLNVMKELPATLMLAPIGFRTLSTRIWTASESGSYGLIGLPGLVLIGVSCLSLAVILWRDQRPR